LYISDTGKKVQVQKGKIEVMIRVPNLHFSEMHDLGKNGSITLVLMVWMLALKV
jgi:hypothetical protein